MPREGDAQVALQRSARAQLDDVLQARLAPVRAQRHRPQLRPGAPRRGRVRERDRARRRRQVSERHLRACTHAACGLQGLDSCCIALLMLMPLLRAGAQGCERLPETPVCCRMQVIEATIDGHWRDYAVPWDERWGYSAVIACSMEQRLGRALTCTLEQGLRRSFSVQQLSMKPAWPLQQPCTRTQ